MATGIQEWYFRKEGSTFNPHEIYANHPEVFSMKVFHGGTFTPSPNRKYFGDTLLVYIDTQCPLISLVSTRAIHNAGISIHAKVADVILNNTWSWPYNWYSRFPNLGNVNVPIINDQLDSLR
ncbi:reverse transcriptase zinc-binding domain-containing protein [Artemisia annua]|uniref:Reverse transcriptase zinc-binding domain-containing protein n=1 Tax=Artemisia annua TaxID=35608 RepID=A0A2U1LLE3_ARTAN|nr:reverse transcriptase zinc-binding domain-containing protein [Artemisia annua]